ncbi:TIGR03546 family protein [Roseimaritima sediminicola]|uniref:TIGR03546 family protein n=1 Tax=Roseimaritima sediminicola TaxID=2662066 RepID=UPI0012984B00|nr:TIGR03546 family protein [Roseimaritima sediminicola]
MFLWLFKQVLNFKRVVAGRNYPHQMAWGLAFGLLLGVIPHGNLLTFALVALVICLNINHAMVALVGVVVSFTAHHLDGYSHTLGQYVLRHPDLAGPLANAWQLPLVPWTNLNNTIVMGSFLIGVAALLPTYAISYPLFRRLAPARENDPTAAAESAEVSQPNASTGVDMAASHASGDRIQRIDRAHGHSAAATAADPPSKETDETDPAGFGTASTSLVETQIDVIRLQSGPLGDEQPERLPPASATDNAQINQALNYLLRRLRTSQQENAA